MKNCALSIHCPLNLSIDAFHMPIHLFRQPLSWTESKDEEHIMEKPTGNKVPIDPCPRKPFIIGDRTAQWLLSVRRKKTPSFFFKGNWIIGVHFLITSKGDLFSQLNGLSWIAHPTFGFPSIGTLRPLAPLSSTVPEAVDRPRAVPEPVFSISSSTSGKDSGTGTPSSCFSCLLWTNLNRTTGIGID